MASASGGRRWLLSSAGFALLTGTAGCSWWPWRSWSFPIETASEEQIRDHVADELTIFRFAANPRILVLDFPSLREQGLMLNRVAALVEKAGLPRERVLNDAELAQAIAARGDTPETFYYGHDYSARSLRRFFALADALNAEERELRALLEQERWLRPGAVGGFISIPRVGADARITARARATILRHELSHGAFFTDAAYAAYVRWFWSAALSEAERAGVRRFLASEGYDAGIEELMVNEMQAYLMFTDDPRFFAPAMVGMTMERVGVLRMRFLAGMPAGWLRETLAEDVEKKAYTQMQTDVRKARRYAGVVGD